MCQLVPPVGELDEKLPASQVRLRLNALSDCRYGCCHADGIMIRQYGECCDQPVPRTLGSNMLSPGWPLIQFGSGRDQTSGTDVGRNVRLPDDALLAAVRQPRRPSIAALILW